MLLINNKSILRHFHVFIKRTLVFIIAIQLLAQQVIFARDYTTSELIKLGIDHYDQYPTGCVGSSPSNTNSLAPYQKGSKIYVIGDSLTVGMRDIGGLSDKLTTSSWTVTNSPQIKAEVGKSIGWGIEQVSSSAEKVKLQDSDTVLVGLGTNNLANYPSSMAEFEDQVRQLVSAIKVSNQNMTIFWTNFYGTGTYNGYNLSESFNGSNGVEGLNSVLGRVASESGVRIIRWSDEGSKYVANNEVHPYSNYPAMSDFVVSNLSSGGNSLNPQTSLAGCSCSAGFVTGNYEPEQRYEYTWGFFVSTKKLSPEATAGIMGNLEAESGINPHNMQNNAPLPDGPVFPTVTDSTGKTVPDPKIAGKYGYGIAQWTSAGRQQSLIDFGAQSGKSTGDLSLQLDFIWKEFSEKYTGVLAKLQQPGVTVAEASEEVLARFEIPQAYIDGGTSRENIIKSRFERSQAIYEKYSGSTGSTVPSQNCNEFGSVVIDPNAPDTTNIPCAAGTVDKGDVIAHRDGKQSKIKICSYEGTVINSQLSASFVALIQTAKTAGINLSGGGFRTIQQQENIYRSWCERNGLTPTEGPYPKATLGEYTRCPGGAPPGYSNHEMGFAIDFECDGSLIPKSYASASSNKCFQWLVANAGKYGLYELGKGGAREKDYYEGWHWSVDGT